jgi:hypothetical protein
LSNLKQNKTIKQNKSLKQKKSLNIIKEDETPIDYSLDISYRHKITELQNIIKNQENSVAQLRTLTENLRKQKLIADNKNKNTIANLEKDKLVVTDVLEEISNNYSKELKKQKNNLLVEGEIIKSGIQNQIASSNNNNTNSNSTTTNNTNTNSTTNNTNSTTTNNNIDESIILSDNDVLDLKSTSISISNQAPLNEAIDLIVGSNYSKNSKKEIQAVESNVEEELENWTLLLGTFYLSIYFSI